MDSREEMEILMCIKDTRPSHHMQKCNLLKGTCLKYKFEILVSYNIFPFDVIKAPWSQCWDKWERKCLLNFYRLDFQMKQTIKYTWDTTCWLQSKKQDMQESSVLIPRLSLGDSKAIQRVCFSGRVVYTLRLAPNLLCIFILHLSLTSPRHLFSEDQIATSFSPGDVAENK